MLDNRLRWRFSQGGASADLFVLVGCAGDDNGGSKDYGTGDGGENNGNEGNGMEPTDSAEAISLWSGGEPVEDGNDYPSVKEAIEVSLTPQ